LRVISIAATNTTTPTVGVEWLSLWIGILIYDSLTYLNVFGHFMSLIYSSILVDLL